MDRLIKEALLPLGLCFFSSLSLGQTSPAGVWNTFDEDSGQAKSQVTIVEKNGLFTGIVTDFLRPNADRTRRCEKCTDDRTDEKFSVWKSSATSKRVKRLTNGEKEKS